MRSTPEFSNDEIDVSNSGLPDCFDGSSFHLAYPTDLYEKARSTMVSWMARLPAGPSPKGPGH